MGVVFVLWAFFLVFLPHLNPLLSPWLAVLPHCLCSALAVTLNPQTAQPRLLASGTSVSPSHPCSCHADLSISPHTPWCWHVHCREVEAGAKLNGPCSVCSRACSRWSENSTQEMGFWTVQLWHGEHRHKHPSDHCCLGPCRAGWGCPQLQSCGILLLQPDSVLSHPLLCRHFSSMGLSQPTQAHTGH